MKRSRSKPGTIDRRRAERAGRWAETLAGLYLQLCFYRIIARRFKTPVGEIDLIARRGRMIVFVEVKQRAGTEARSMALGAVNMDRISRAAQWYLARNGKFASFDCRFDVLLLAPWHWPHHLKNIFPAQ